MASKYGTSKFYGLLMQSLAHNCQRYARPFNNFSHRNYFLNQWTRLLPRGVQLANTRSISAIQTDHTSSVFRNESNPNETQNDEINSVILNDKEKRETLVEKVKSAISTDLPFGQIYAIVHIGGKQFKITSNDIIMIHKMPAKCGDKIRLRKILAVGGREFSLIGKPLLSHDHIYIEATVLEKTKGRNVIVFKKKRRKNYKKWREHRQDLTVLRINKIIIKPEIVE